MYLIKVGMKDLSGKWHYRNFEVADLSMAAYRFFNLIRDGDHIAYDQVTYKCEELKHDAELFSFK